jgi:hypothetical protein
VDVVIDRIAASETGAPVASIDVPGTRIPGLLLKGRSAGIKDLAFCKALRPDAEIARCQRGERHHQRHEEHQQSGHEKCP